MAILKIVLGILIFGLIVLVHEFGHFTLARAFGVKVIEFSIGFGPSLFSINGKKTKYSFKLLPFGGSCQMKDEMDVDKTSGAAENDSFISKPAWQRFLIIFAGPAFNFILAFICAVVLISCVGIDKPIVSSVMEGYPAQEAGIQGGDTIVKLNSRNIKLFREINLYNALHTGEPIDVVYKHDGELKNAHIVPEYNEEEQRYLIGITSRGEYTMPENIWEYLEYGRYEVRYNILCAVDSIVYMLRGKASAGDLMGPVGIVDAVGDTVQESMSYGMRVVILTLINFVILFSSNVGVMNLLPIPALDGCRMLFTLVEMIAGRPLNRKVESIINFVGLALLLALMVFVMFNDVIRIIHK